MKEDILLFVILIAHSVLCSGQESNLHSIGSESNAIKSCHKQVENKTICLSNFTSDTLTYQQFKNCNKITVKSLPGEVFREKKSRLINSAIFFQVVLIL